MTLTLGFGFGYMGTVFTERNFRTCVCVRVWDEMVTLRPSNIQ